MTTKSKYPSQQTEYAVRYNTYYRMGYRRQVSALGSMRRVQALHAIGYSRSDLAKLIGVPKDYLEKLARGRNARISREYAEKIDKAYRTLCVQPLHDTRTATQARTWARKNGYFPPMAWNDIDDPKERPRGVQWPTTCKFRVAITPSHPQGRACGNPGPLKRGMCERHYQQVLYREKKAA